MNDRTLLSAARRNFHATLLNSMLRTDAKGVPSNADKHSKASVSRSGLMLTQRPQCPRPARHFAAPKLDTHPSLRGVTGLRCAVVWIVAVRPPRRPALDHLHACNWRGW